MELERELGEKDKTAENLKVLIKVRESNIAAKDEALEETKRRCQQAEEKAKFLE